jgi:hypothetical protein
MSRRHRDEPNWDVKVRKPDYVTSKERVMSAKNEFYEGSAVWKRVEGHWRCVKADPILFWMRKMDVGTAKLALVRRGYSWEWK